MKVKVYFFLFLFVAFLVTPVVVNLLHDNGKKVVFAINEEENSKDFKVQFKKDFKLDNNLFSLYSVALKLRNNLIGGDDIRDYSIYLDPVSPPPRRA